MDQVEVNTHMIAYRSTRSLEALSEISYEGSHQYKHLLVCLHQTPSSSVSYQSLIEGLEQRSPSLFVLALDTSGFGESPPLSQAQSSIAELAAPLYAVVERFMSALPHAQLHLCGHHTGASLALELAVRFAVATVEESARESAREYAAAQHALSSLILIGLPVFPEAELASYKLKTERLYAQVEREQVMLSHSSSTHQLRHTLYDQLSLKDPSASPAVIEREVEARLRSGERLPKVYTAVFAYDHISAMRRVNAPVLLIAPVDDQVCDHLEYQRGQLCGAGLDVRVARSTGGGYALDSASDEFATLICAWVSELRRDADGSPSS